MVLAVVESRQRYPAEIAATLVDAGFPVQEGTLYPLLSRLRREGSVDHEWHESPAGPPRKYFTLTQEGARQLVEFREYWSGLSRMIETIGR
jgi:PadR family transcriptional regulator PadR